jgi:hypothetical protein
MSFGTHKQWEKWFIFSFFQCLVIVAAVSCFVLAFDAMIG